MNADTSKVSCKWLCKSYLGIWGKCKMYLLCNPIVEEEFTSISMAIMPHKLQGLKILCYAKECPKMLLSEDISCLNRLNVFR